MNKEKTLPVHRIISFSNVDGPGNRMAIFVQGCNFRCSYCHNPETIPSCDQSGVHTDYSLEELVREVKKVKPYIRGITISGGEPTLYGEFINKFFKEIESLKLTRYIDTNLSFSQETLEIIEPHTDGFLVDIKGYGELKNLVKTRFYQDLSMLRVLLKKSKVIEARIVCIEDLIDLEKTVTETAKILRYYPDVPLHLIRVHLRGMSKKNALKLKELVPSEEKMDELYQRAKNLAVKNLKMTL